ncbi:hypothetical protein DL89DRAFT_266151 [Linderina pennispora]|uniref:Uncharacterized protein n=1 Tax=Linderina pennispora TaxID=61395 RepID=A0A1Y1WD23_9FUNG|nr:uncharacterized protein DL89DRAFT_266151 [Linderina pennispora]ORX71136.1 hypothetical protein DL89DRAFT_266151 [Linderina pennispora]
MPFRNFFKRLPSTDTRTEPDGSIFYSNTSTKSQSNAHSLASAAEGNSPDHVLTYLYSASSSQGSFGTRPFTYHS